MDKAGNFVATGDNPHTTFFVAASPACMTQGIKSWLRNWHYVSGPNVPGSETGEARSL
jgi:hypothetical protein